MPVFCYAFAAVSVVGAIALVSFRNPVSSAISMVGSFIGLAALFIGLNAYFVGIIQILVYAGAIMVLFLFIIMLLDLKVPSTFKRSSPLILVGGLIIPFSFVIQLSTVLSEVRGGNPKALPLQEAAESFYDQERDPDNQSEIYNSLQKKSLPDVNLIGLTLFGHKGDNASIRTPGYNFPLQITGVLLLVATVGVVALSLKRKQSKSGGPES